MKLLLSYLTISNHCCNVHKVNAVIYSYLSIYPVQRYASRKLKLLLCVMHCKSECIYFSGFALSG